MQAIVYMEKDGVNIKATQRVPELSKEQMHAYVHYLRKGSKAKGFKLKKVVFIR